MMTRILSAFVLFAVMGATITAVSVAGASPAAAAAKKVN